MFIQLHIVYFVNLDVILCGGGLYSILGNGHLHFQLAVIRISIYMIMTIPSKLRLVKNGSVLTMDRCQIQNNHVLNCSSSSSGWIRESH